MNWTDVWTSFYLLSDCVWDIESDRYSRSNMRMLLPYAMSYKFWFGQTGRGHIMEHSRFERLEDIISPCSSWYEKEYIEQIKKFVDSCKVHLEEYEELFPKFEIKETEYSF